MREGRFTGSLLMLVLVLAVAGCAGVQVPGKLDRGVEDPQAVALDKLKLDRPQAVALDKLRAQSEQPPNIHFEAGIPRFVSVQVPIPKDAPDDPVVRALDFLERYRDFYRIADPRAQLYLERSVTNETGQHIFLGQHHDDIPVFGAQLAVHLSNDAVIATNGNYLTDIPNFLPPAVDEKRAETIALKDMGANTERIDQPKLVYFNRRLFMTPVEIASSELDGDTHQAWRLTVVHNSEGHGYSYFIDAQTGAVLFRLNLSPSHAAQRDFRILTANGAGGSIFCGHSNPTDWFDENGVLSGAMPDAEGNNAFRFTHQVYDFFFDNFHQHSWAGNDNTIGLALDYGGRPWVGNAAFVSSCGHFIFGNNMATLDVVAHEITHGITATSAGLLYSNQPGALNESYSDVFAAMIDKVNWTIGEGSSGTRSCFPALVTLPPYPQGTSRDMSNPPACTTLGVTHPDHMSNFRIMTADDGGVHINSGIPNKVAFLIAAGGTHNGITVSGIGRTKTAELYFIVLTSFIAYNADFNSAQLATVYVAQAAGRGGTLINGFTAADACVVVNAFASVGLGLADVDCDGVSDVNDPLIDRDGDTIGDSVDNCPTVSNPDQADSDGNKIGNACDLDADNDGFSNALDNCPYLANPSQVDSDLDRWGDVCDNCPVVWNADQLNTDRVDDGGDSCDRDDDNDFCLDEADDRPKEGWSKIGGRIAVNCPSAVEDVLGWDGSDSDGDGLRNCADDDDDGDRILDGDDRCPVDQGDEVLTCQGRPTSCPLQTIQDVCQRGGCNRFEIRIMSRVNPSWIVPTFTILEEVVVMFPSGEVTIETIEAAVLGQGQPSKVRLEIWSKASQLEPGRFVARIAEYDPQAVTRLRSTGRSALVVAVAENGAGISVQKASAPRVEAGQPREGK